MALSSYRLLYFRDDLQMTTWLLIGASLQAALLVALPLTLAILPTIILLSSRIVNFFLIQHGLLRDNSLDGVHIGKFSTQIPRADGTLASEPSDQEVVVMISGARSSHIKGRFAPGFQEINEIFGDMWREASRNREKWGFLGKTSTLFATETDSGNSMCWISYWKSMAHLQAFALGPAHRKGWDLFNATTKKNPHIGIMHETYAAPKGHWETVYLNFKPFGFGQTKHLTDQSKKEGKTVSSLREANKQTWSRMSTRMGRGDTV